ncbi:MAG TPA: hypothetical protein VGM67_04985 [Gemmatimonadaceae bacterium]|jgi:hypothetical protein
MMSIHDDDFTNSNDDWTPEERKLLAALSRERVPPLDLKSRTARAVRQRNATAAHAVRSPRSVLALGAAAAVIFIAGTLVGYVAAVRSARAARDSQTTTHETVANAQHDAPAINQVRYVVWY